MKSRSLPLFLQTAGTRVLGMASSMVLVVLLSRTLSPDQYGVYSLFATTYVFGNLVLGLGLSGNLSREVPGKAPEEANRLLATFFLAEMGVGAVLLLLLLAVGVDSRLAGLLGAGQYPLGFRLMFIAIWVDLGAGSCLNHLLATKRFGRANVLTLLRSSALGPLLLGVFLFRGRLSPDTVAGTWLAVAGVALGFGVVATELPVALRFGTKWSALRGAVSFGLLLASQSMTFYFLKLADRYFLARYVDLHQVGIYSFAYTLSNIVYSLSALVLAGLYQPHVVEAHNRGEFVRRDELLAQMTRIAVTLLLVASVLAAIFAERIVSFARPSYIESAAALPWLLLILLPVVMAIPAAMMLMLERRLIAGLIGGLAAVAVATTLDLALIPRLSYRGALAGSLAGYLTLAAIQHSVAGTWRFLTPVRLLDIRRDIAQLRGNR